MGSEQPAPASAWQDAVLPTLKNSDVRHIAYVPDAGHSSAIRAAEADPDIHATVLTTEEEGIGYLAGAWLGGERGAMLLQSSGVGNCINALSVVRTCRMPLLMIVTMRGEWREFNPWQLPMGQGAAAHLEQSGVIVKRVEDGDAAGEMVAGAAALAFETMSAVAVLIAQHIIGIKTFSEPREND